MSFLNILQGWYNYANGTPEIKQMMAERIVICEGCPKKEILNSLGQKIVKAIDGQGSVLKCGQCGCPLAAKTADPNQSCPHPDGARWGPLKNPHTYY